MRLAATTLLLAILCSEAAAQPGYRVKLEFDVRVPMRDGVTLSADIYRPDTVEDSR